MSTSGRVFAIFIALIGVVFTGIVVALAVNAAAAAIKSSEKLEPIKERIEQLAQ